MAKKKVCYICSSNKFVDDHHVDYCEGKLSPEKEPLCRRCHRTYHDLGVDYFDDEYLDKAVELENRRREIYNANLGYFKKKRATRAAQFPPWNPMLGKPITPLPLLRREDIRRSAYWNKQHGISLSPLKKRVKGVPFRIPNNPPLCGEDWLKAHLEDYTPEEIAALTIEVEYGNRRLPPVSLGDKRGTVKTIVRNLGDG